MASWCSVNFWTYRNPTITIKFPSKCLQKCFEFFFFLLLFLLRISNRVARRCLHQQDLRICVLQITQNLSHPKSRMINYIIIKINFLDLLFWFKHDFIWKLQRIEFSSKVCKFVFCKLCKIIQVTLNHRLLII